MAYLKKPQQDEEQEQGQQTSFMTSQGPGMVGAGSGEGGLGIAGGSPSGRSPFVNPEEYKNVRAGQRLGESLQRTFTDPARQISGQIGTERGAFEQAANKQKLSFLGDTGKDALLERARKDPLSFGQNVSELKSRYGTQYTGPMQFQASEKITDPLAKLQERMSTYGTQGGPGTGIEREDIRRSLIGEIMKPGTAGEGKLSLEENLLTSSPDNLKNLANIIGRVGYTGEGPQTTFSGSQAVPTPIARLNRARRELAELVERRQKEAADTRGRATEAIQTGAGLIQGDVRTAIDQAVADARARQSLLGPRTPEPQQIQGRDLSMGPGDSLGPGEDKPSDPNAEMIQRPVIDVTPDQFEYLPEMFTGEYTDEEKALAKRLGLTDEQVQQAQGYMENILDPTGLLRKEPGATPGYLGDEDLAASLGLVEGWEDQDYEAGDFLNNFQYDTINPLDTLFSFLDPEQVYTQEQMINPEQAQTLAALQGIMGQAPSITRAEDAQGADLKSIQMGNVDDWLSNLGIIEQEQRDIATQKRDDRISAQAEAQLAAEYAPPKRTGDHFKDQENYFEWRKRMEELAKDEKELGGKIDAYDSWKKRYDEIASNVDGYNYDERQFALQQLGKPPQEPSLWDRLNNFMQGQWATEQLKNEKAKQDKADKDFAEALANIDWSFDFNFTPGGNGGGGGSTGWSQSNVPSGPAQPTQASTGQYYA
jgi:hypothetical protein